jgi:SAM-dependent methyltransferase
MSSDFDYKDYWNKRLSGNFGLEAVGYIGLGKDFNKWMYRLRKRNLWGVIKKVKINLAESNVLDVGSGTGFYIEIWRELNVKSITGIDISVQAIENLKRKFPEVSFHLQDISASEKTQTFQIVSCMDVLFHVVNDDKFKQAIHNLSKSLISGGFLILTDNFPQQQEKRLPHHVSRTLSGYEKILKEADLEIVSRKPVFFFLNYPVDSNSLFLKFIWKFFLRFIPGNNWLGNLLGAIFFPIDVILTKLISEGPSTEIVVCKKK